MVELSKDGAFYFEGCRPTPTPVKRKPTAVFVNEWTCMSCMTAVILFDEDSIGIEEQPCLECGDMNWKCTEDRTLVN